MTGVSKVRQLSEEWMCFRIGDGQGQYPVFSGIGASLYPGRWNVRDQKMIYTSRNYSTAMLEVLVYFSGIMPPNQHFVEIRIPAGTSYEVFSTDHYPNWYKSNSDVARTFGSEWYGSGRSCLLIVPSVVARMENNVLINSGHPDYAGIKASLEKPVWWDDRLFSPSD